MHNAEQIVGKHKNLLIYDGADDILIGIHIHPIYGIIKEITLVSCKTTINLLQCKSEAAGPTAECCVS